MTQTDEWRVDGPDEAGFYSVVDPLVDADGLGSHTLIATEMREGPARLLAAAPKMLATIKKLIWPFRQDGETWAEWAVRLGPNYSGPLTFEEIDELRAFINSLGEDTP